MPRKYKRKVGARPYSNFSAETLQNALDEVSSGRLSLKKASELFNINRSTLHRKLTSLKQPGSILPRSPGGQTVFSRDEELIICSHIITMSSFGFPITRLELRLFAQAYLNGIGRKVTQFQNKNSPNLPGEDWANSFVDRHESLIGKQMCQSVSRYRAGVNRKTMNAFFDNLSVILEDVHPSNIWNYVETNLQDDPGEKRVHIRKAAKRPEIMKNSTKASVSIMMCGNAEGSFAPPYVTYQAECVYPGWVEGGPPGSRYNRSTSGWFDAIIFEDWFENTMLPILGRKTGTKVLIGDNCSSYLSSHIITLCEDNNIKFVALPIQSTHLLQPMDVGFFRPIKSAWKQILDAWKSTVEGQGSATVPKSRFPRLLKKLMKKLHPQAATNLKGRFKETGIFPLNREIQLAKVRDNFTQNTDIESHIANVSSAFLDYMKNLNGTVSRKKAPIWKRKQLEISEEISISFDSESDTEELEVIDSNEEETSEIDDSFVEDRHLPSSCSFALVERADMNSPSPATLMVKSEPAMAVGDTKNEELIIPDATHSFMEGPSALIKEEPTETGDCEILENPYDCIACGLNCESQQNLITHYETKCWTHATVSEESMDDENVKSEETEDPLIGDEAPSDERVQNIGHAFEVGDSPDSHQLLFYCNFCGVASSEKQELMVHMESHIEVTYLSCQHCVHVYSDRYHLKNYECRDELEKPHVCVHCPFRSQWWQELKDHCFSHHHRNSSQLHNLNSVGSLGNPATTISSNYYSANPPSLSVSLNANSNLQSPEIILQKTNKDNYIVVLKNVEPNSNLTGASTSSTGQAVHANAITSVPMQLPSSNNQEFLKHMLVSNSMSAVAAPLLQSPKYLNARSTKPSEHKYPPLIPVNAMVQNPTSHKTTPDQNFASIRKDMQPNSDAVLVSGALPSCPTNIVPRIIVPRPPEVAGPLNLPTVIPRDVSLNPLLKVPQAVIPPKPKPISTPKKKVQQAEHTRKNNKIPCPYCDYLSRDKWNLRTHVLTHTKEKPFRCNLCNYRASQAAHLRKHMKTHVFGRRAMVK